MLWCGENGCGLHESAGTLDVRLALPNCSWLHEAGPGPAVRGSMRLALAQLSVAP